MTTTTLKQCPFCSSDQYVRVTSAEHFGVRDGFIAVCSAYGFDGDPKGCGASTGVQASMDDAVAAWNRRAAPEGWRLVPVEASEEMLKAASWAQRNCNPDNYGNADHLVTAYRAMIAAAPDRES